MSAFQEVVELTRERFPQYEGLGVAVEPLEKGGSDRKFFRVRVEGREPLIYVQYGQQKEENRHYVEIGQFLEKFGVRVPRMFRHEGEFGRIWMEDLGEKDLWSFRNESWEVRRPLYEATLLGVLRMHTLGQRVASPEVAALGLQAPFDEALYRWEQDYFLQNCLGRHFGVGSEKLGEIRGTLQAWALELAGLPRVLVHRDFQSQNIVVNGNGEPCFIDFQGMRFGLPQYDVASLLWDPYVELSAREREELLGFYEASWEASGGERGAAFHHIYRLCSAQRLMQALGAYGFLGHERQRPEFLRHIPVALPRLRQVLAGLPGAEVLSEMLGVVCSARGPVLR
jgi:aminoglycoside/choline kinase family phosphotransferase